MKNNAFVNKVYSSRSINRLKKKIKLLGINSKLNVEKFLNSRLIISIFIFVTFGLLFTNGYIYAPIGTFIFYIGYEYIILDYKIKKRNNVLDNEAILYFEILSLSLESGRSIKDAIEVTCDNVNSTLSEEFNFALYEIKYGKSLEEALKNMIQRIPNKSINNVILNIIEANIFGISLYKAINSQVDYLREKKFLEIKGKINKMPVKISIVSVVFFIPIILLLILGPILVNYIK